MSAWAMTGIMTGRTIRAASGALTLASLLVSLPPSLGVAAPVPDRAPSDESWDLTLIPYVWGTALEGSIEADRGEAEFDASFGDVLDRANVAASAIFDARRGPWVLWVDNLVAEFESDEDLGPFDIDSTTRQVIVDTKLGYCIWSRASDCRTVEDGDLAFDFMLGARYLRIRNEIDVDPGRSNDETFDWVDPTAGLRLRGRVGERLSLTIVGDVGGFDIGSASELTWSGIVLLGIRLSDRWNLDLGYKALDVDRSKLDLREEGPLVGLSYAF